MKECGDCLEHYGWTASIGPFVVQKPETKTLLTILALILIGYRGKARETFAGTADPYQFEVRRHRFYADSHAAAAEVFRASGLLFDALHRFGVVLDQHHF